MQSSILRSEMDAFHDYVKKLRYALLHSFDALRPSVQAMGRFDNEEDAQFAETLDFNNVDVLDDRGRKCIIKKAWNNHLRVMEDSARYASLTFEPLALLSYYVHRFELLSWKHLSWHAIYIEPLSMPRKQEFERIIELWLDGHDNLNSFITFLSEALHKPFLFDIAYMPGDKALDVIFQRLEPEEQLRLLKVYASEDYSLRFSGYHDFFAQSNVFWRFDTGDLDEEGNVVPRPTSEVLKVFEEPNFPYWHRYPAEQVLENLFEEYFLNFDLIDSGLQDMFEGVFSQEEYADIWTKVKTERFGSLNGDPGKDCFYGLRPVFNDHPEYISSIIDVLIQHGCINDTDEDRKILFFRLSGKQKPHYLRAIKWHRKENARKKGVVRQPAELYYLISTMFTNAIETNRGLILQFFEFDDETLSLVKTILDRNKEERSKQGDILQNAAVRKEFWKDLHCIAPEVFS